MLSMRKKLPRSSRPRRERFVVYAPAKRNSRSCSTFFSRTRVTVSALAAALGVTPARAGALLSHELSTGRLVVRTEIARPYSGWPVYAWYFLRLDGRKEAIAQRLSHLREARLVASTIGSYDIALAVWLRSIDDVQRLEGYLADQFPGVSVVDRSIVLRTPHHLHRTIDVSGRSMPKHG